MEEMNCNPILTNFQIQDVGQTFQIIIGLFFPAQLFGYFKL
jgi:hypothetical protein